MKQYIVSVILCVSFAAYSDVNIGITKEQRSQVAYPLRVMLADEYVVFTKLFKYHWNVTGMAFGSLHALFQEQYEQVFSLIDDIAERIRALGELPIGTLSEFSEYSNIQEYPGSNPDASTMLSNLVADYEAMIRYMREQAAAIEAIGDIVTANFIEEIIEKHEKGAWMLRAHLA